MPETPVHLLVVGLLVDAQKRELLNLVTNAATIQLPYDLEKLSETLPTPPGIVLLGLPPDGIAMEEVAQLLRGTYPFATLYLVASSKTSLDRKTLIKNGLTDVFFLPFEHANLTKSLKEVAVRLGSGERVFRKVKMIDVQPDKVLNFNTYLHLAANNKYVKFSLAGESLDVSRINQLKNHQVRELSVPVEEMSAVYAYTAASLKDIQNNPQLSATERSERLESSAREVITGLFSGDTTSTERGKQSIADLQNVIRTYITDSTAQGKSWYSRLLAVSAEAEDSYSHATATSSFAALFGIALGLDPKAVENIAVAGLLHDLGMARIPLEVLKSDPKDWLPVDKEVFQNHPESSVSIIRDRKLIVADDVHKIILQHHERWDGQGFPKKLAGDRIHLGAQLLSIADELSERMTQTGVRPQFNLKTIFKDLLKESGSDPGRTAFNPALLKKIVELFEGC